MKAKSVMALQNGQKLEIVINIPEKDLEDIVFNDLDKRLRGITFKTVRDAKTFWKNLAGQKLKSSRNFYVGAISSEIITETEGELRMTGWPVMLEVGNPSPFDMKPMLLQGRQSRVIPMNLKTNPPHGTKGRDYFVNWPFVKAKVFRTVKQDSDGWIYPKTPGAQLLVEVVKEIEERILPKYIDEAFNS